MPSGFSKSCAANAVSETNSTAASESKAMRLSGPIEERLAALCVLCVERLAALCVLCVGQCLVASACVYRRFALSHREPVRRGRGGAAEPRKRSRFFFSQDPRWRTGPAKPRKGIFF
jgi:hypothetical protein